MTSDILEWVNSGFDGKPAFVTDLLGLLEEIELDIAADFIYEDQFDNACKAFQLDARTELANVIQEQNEPYDGFKKRAECTADDIPGGDQGAFLSGEFTAGGWSMWFETVLNHQNTSLGLFAMGLQQEKKTADENKKEKELEYLANDGFLNQEVCEIVDGKEECLTVTPGSIIKDLASKALQAPMDRLINADEIDEILGALFSNLAQQAVGGINGMLGLGGNAEFANLSFGAEGNLSYLDAVRKEQSNGGGASGNRVEDALRSETQVLELQLAIIQELDAVSTAFLDAQEPFEGDSCWNLDFPEEFTDKIEELTEKVPLTVDTVVTLEAMLTEYKEGKESETLQKLSRMQAEGKLSGRTAAIQYENYLRNQLRSAIEDFETQIEDEIDSC